MSQGKKQKDRERMRASRRPDKPCIRCGREEIKILRVKGMTGQKEKVVLCLYCLIDLEYGTE